MGLRREALRRATPACGVRTVATAGSATAGVAGVAAGEVTRATRWLPVSILRPEDCGSVDVDIPRVHKESAETASADSPMMAATSPRFKWRAGRRSAEALRLLS